jgi:hypothetical protein
MTRQPVVSVELEAFLREQIGLYSTDQVNPWDRLEEDLHVSGDDAAELIEAFVKRFKIENGDFTFQRYFFEEGYNLFFFIDCLFRRKRRNVEKEPLTVAMLQRTIDLGVWDSERIKIDA